MESQFDQQVQSISQVYQHHRHSPCASGQRVNPPDMWPQICLHHRTEREIEGGSMRRDATNLSSPLERERERETVGGSMRRVATNLSSPQERERERVDP